MPLILPLTNDPDRVFSVLLGEQILTVRTYYNPTTPGWYMDLRTQDGTALALGLALLPVVNVLQGNPDLIRIYGQFRTVVQDDAEYLTLDALGNTALVYWFAPGEWEATDDGLTADLTLPFDVRDYYHA